MPKLSKNDHLKKLLSVKFGWVCWYCGLDLAYRVRHLDHVTPRSKGGTDDLDNLALSCSFCNMAKQDLELGEFYSWLEQIANKSFKPRIRIGEPHPMSSLYQEAENKHGTGSGMPQDESEAAKRQPAHLGFKHPLNRI